ncbi:MAG: HEAT repeat domain-containing protein [Sedimentisphaerales bacterium]|nr:HEAT repeat domain-containing protein [Sedimentisphaerales bacterium]
MEHKRKKAIIKKRKKYILLFMLLFIVYLAVFVFGCDNILQMKPAELKSTNLNVSWSESLRIIQDALVDPDPLVRTRAIEVVASTGQLKLMPQVQRLMQDQYVPVRFAATVAVGDTEYLPAKRSLNILLKDEDTNVVIAAAYAMVKLGSSGHLQILRESIADSDQMVRANAVLLLGKTGDKGSLKLLWNTMQDRGSDDKVAYQAAEAIATLGDRKIYQKLWTMLISAYHDVRTMGVIAMGELKTPEAKNALVKMLDDDILEVRLVAAGRLGLLRDPVGEPKVLEVFEKNLTSEMELEAAERTNVLTALAIGQIKTPALKKFLPKMLQNNSKFVRIAAAKAVFQCLK